MNACFENVLSSGNRLQPQVRPNRPAPADPIRVWLVDDDSYVRDLLPALLSREQEIDCSRIFPCAKTALTALAREHAPEVMLVDLHLGAEDGVKVAGTIKVLAPRTRVFVISTFYNSCQEARALRAGALGFIAKHNVDRMLERIRALRPARLLEEAEHWIGT